MFAPHWNEERGPFTIEIESAQSRLSGDADDRDGFAAVANPHHLAQRLPEVEVVGEAGRAGLDAAGGVAAMSRVSTTRSAREAVSAVS